VHENLGDAVRKKFADELLSDLVGMNAVAGQQNVVLQTKEVSLFQIRQDYSGDKGEPDVPH
jgi:hypothetical protein